MHAYLPTSLLLAQALQVLALRRAERKPKALQFLCNRALRVSADVSFFGRN
jgi:hypothetical protein